MRRWQACFLRSVTSTGNLPLTQLVSMSSWQGTSIEKLADIKYSKCDDSKLKHCFQLVWRMNMIVVFNCLIMPRITENLGSGQFGQVSKGVWQSPVGVVPVAVKTLKERKEQDVDEVRFLQEAAINGQFHHRNVVKLLGVVTLGKPVSIN